MPPKKTTALTPDAPVTALPGISETRGALFAKMGIETLYDLCRHYPRAYELRGKTTTVLGAAELCGRGEPLSLVLTVGIGLIGTWRVLGQKAAPVLREL